jgi:hypothetical protein
LENGGRLFLAAVRTPAVEDVVVVPHHQAGDRRQRLGHRFRREPVTIHLDIEAFELVQQTLPGIHRHPSLARQFIEAAQCRHCIPELIGVDLIATKQQHVQRLALVGHRQVPPDGVLVGDPLHVAGHGKAVAGVVADTQRLLPPRHRETPAPFLAGEAVFEDALVRLHRYCELVAEERSAADFAQPRGGHARTRGLPALGPGQRAGCRSAVVRDHDRDSPFLAHATSKT